MPANLSPEEEDQLFRAWQEEVTAKPPTVGLIGVSGVGKSSTINAIFRTDLPISHTTACTKDFAEVAVDVAVTEGPAVGTEVGLRVFDAPGLGEDVRRDPDYLTMYRENLPQCDVILWITAARNRAVALDQQYLRELAEFGDRMVFGLSQVDLVEPRNWKEGMPIPSREQEENIAEIVLDRSERFSATLGRKVEIIPFSNYKLFNLEWLFTSMLQRSATGRKWILRNMKNFSLESVVSADVVRGGTQPDRGPENHESMWDRIRGFAARTGGRDTAELIRAGTDVLQLLRGDAGSQSQFDLVLSETIGRTDVRERPLTREELNKLSERVRRDQSRHLGLS